MRVAPWAPPVKSVWLSFILVGFGSTLSGCLSQNQDYVVNVTIEEPAAAIADVLAETLQPTGYQLTVQSVEDPDDIFSAIANGDAQLGVVEEPTQMLSGLTTIAPLYPSVLHVLHREDRAPQNFRQLIHGQKIYSGPLGGAAARLLQRFAVESGVRPDQYRLLDNPWTEQADVYFILGGLLPMDSVKRFAGYQLFSFGDAALLGRGTVAEAIELRYPRLRSFVLPARLYEELNPTAIVTLSVRSVLIGSATLEENRAYDIAAQVFEHWQELASVYPLVSRELNDSFDGDDLALPLHPGVRRYLDKDKPGFFERYAELLALSVMLSAAVASGLVRFNHQRRQAKKDRVDVYYNKVLDLRSKIEPSLSSEQVQAIAGDVRQVQRDVFALLVDERVDADATLTIFLELSNQVLRELQDLVHGPPV